MVLRMPRPMHIRRRTHDTVDMRGRIEEACRFIEDAVQRHERALGLEVGEYLLTYVYDDDLDYIFKRDPTKDRSLRDIAEATPVSLRSLSRWLKAAAVRRRLRAMGMDPDLGLQKLAALYDIEDVKTLATMVTWAQHVPAAQVTDLIRRWTAHLDQGGDLKDLLDEPLPDPPGPTPRRTHTTDELIVPRLLTLLLEWTRHHHFNPTLRGRLIHDLEILRASLARGVRA